MTERDWVEWHRPYQDPKSPLSRRLATVRRHLGIALDRAPAGPLRLVSMCAGQGHDVIGALVGHRRREEVSATLVELDERNVDAARSAVADTDLEMVEVRQQDAGSTDVYQGAVPADVVLVCGVFGNVTDADIERTILALPSLCRSGACVIWTRHRRPPDLTERVRRWFSDAGFVEEAFVAPPDTIYGVGVHRLVAEPLPFVAGRRLFEFVGYDVLQQPR